MGAGHDTISFLSDYGTDDEFVGVVHSVIRAIAPHAAVLDITHGIPPHDIRSGSLTLARSVQYLNPGVVLAVVDPGVGTDRRGVAVEVGGGQSILVGPDNGLLASAVSLCEGATRVVELTNDDYRLPAPGATFDGRDVFAPAAAHLCNGVDPGELGPAVDPMSLLPGLLPVTRSEDGTVIAEVLWVDRFGNVQLNVDPDEVESLGPTLRIRAGDGVRTARLADAYARIGVGEVGLVVDSYGLLSIAVDSMSAAELLGLAAGDIVKLDGTPETSSVDGAGPTPIRLRTNET